MKLSLLLDFTAKLAEPQGVKQAAWYQRTCLGRKESPGSSWLSAACYRCCSTPLL